LLPQLIKAIDDVERESEELVDHTVHQVILLIVIGMVAYIVARLIYSYLNKKLIESRALCCVLQKSYNMIVTPAPADVQFKDARINASGYSGPKIQIESYLNA
jgi:hypothetical protein